MPSHYIMVCILFAQDFSYEEFTDKQYIKKKNSSSIPFSYEYEAIIF